MAYRGLEKMLDHSEAKQIILGGKRVLSESSNNKYNAYIVKLDTISMQ
tara:strand:- start:240 stop:383 length:144 start_codon:yes stop_codon:yes gene_type:complete